MAPYVDAHGFWPSCCWRDTCVGQWKPSDGSLLRRLGLLNGVRRL